jgi:hypothetical protein
VTVGQPNPVDLNPSKVETRAIPSNGGDSAQTSLDEILDKLAEYFQIPTPQPGSSGNSVLAQDRKANPDTLYDEMYLDWMKREAGEPMSPATPAPQMLGSADPPSPQVAPYAYAYPPMAYSPFFPSLASFKMQKAMAQAQVDAALSTMFNITTTPKPLKLKLKITIPGMSDMTQLGQITSALSANLPPGSTFGLD